MQPSPEAVAWGKRQASRSPRWSETKWRRVGTLLGVELITSDKPEQKPDPVEPEASTMRDAA